MTPYQKSLIFILVGLLISCASTNRITQLQKSRDLWNSHGLTNYSFSYQIDCFCPPEQLKPYRIVVRNSVVVKAVSLDGKTEIPSSLLSSWETIPELFNMVAKAIAGHAYELRTEYDPKYGYPTKIFVDHKKRMADDEGAYRVWDLQQHN